MAAGMTISRFAKSAGVGVETVRYYQRRGLLPVPSPRSTSFREYDTSMIKRLRLIRGLQSAGFTLREVSELLRLDRCSDRLKIQEIASRKFDELNERMRELRRISKGLKTVLQECQDTRDGIPCPIIEAFDI